MKTTGGIEKGLLRTAAAGLLPEDLLGRRNSIYPGAADRAYDTAIDGQMRRLLGQLDAPLFGLVSRERLTTAYESDPLLPGTMAIAPSRMAPAAFLVDVNRWLERSGFLSSGNEELGAGESPLSVRDKRPPTANPGGGRP